MFGLFSLFRARPASTRRLAKYFRPQIDLLEVRDCPAAALISLNAEVLAGHNVQLSGNVYGPNAAGATVELHGAVELSTVADAYGHFALTTNNASLGSVSATAVDTNSNTIDTTTAIISAATPTVTLEVSYNSETSVTLSGDVTSVDGVYASVSLFGVVDTTTLSPDAFGHFTVTLDASALGEISATATDTWSNVSAEADVFLASDTPAIVEFQANNGFANIITLTGRVTDENPGGRTVTFAGMAGLTGRTAVTDSNGNFSITFTRPAGQGGTVSASVIDPWGQPSAPVYTNILGIPGITLNSEALAGHLVQLSGDIMGDDVAGALVEFQGGVVGSTYADASGHYVIVVSDASLGSVSAIATTLDNRVTDAGTSTIAVSAPTVTLNVAYNGGLSVTLSGDVTSVDGVYTIVTLSGVVDTTTVYPDSLGHFTVTLTANSFGDVNAIATDTWSNVSDVATIAVVSYAPVISSVTFDSVNPKTNDLLTVQVSGPSDANNDPVSFTYVWSVNGIPVQTHSSAMLTDELHLDQTGFGDKGDVISVSVTPSTSIGTMNYGTPVTISTTVVNSAPVIDTSSLISLQSFTGDAITLQINATDADGDNIVFDPPTGLPSGLSLSSTGLITGTISPSANTTTPYSVTLTAGDGTASGTTTFDWTIVQPTITLEHPGNQTYYHNVPVALGLSASNNAGHPLTYSVDSATPLPDGLQIHADQGSIWGTMPITAVAATPYTVTVIATDVVAGVSTSQTFTMAVLNHAPVIDHLTFDDPNPKTNDVLTVHVNSPSDGNADAISYTYEWTVDGIVVQTTTTTNDLDSLDLSLPGFGDKGQVIAVSVTPFDSLNAGTAVTASATVVNSAPVLTPWTYYASTNSTGTTLGILSPDDDVDQDPLDIHIDDGPDHGTLTDNFDGTFDFVPDTGWTGTDEFSIYVNDGTADSNEVTMFIVVADGLPIATFDYVEIENSSTTTITLKGESGNGNAISYHITSLPTRGTLFDGTYQISASDLVSGPYAVLDSLHQLSFVPDANKFGFDEFSFKVNDGSNDSEIQPVRITVVPTSNAPTIDPNVGIDVPNAGATVSDIDLMSYVAYTGNGNLTLTINQPQYGTLSYNSATSLYDYLADNTFAGSTEFTFEVSDGVNAIKGTGSFLVQAPADGSTPINPAHANTISLALNPSRRILTFGPTDTVLPQNAGQYSGFRAHLISRVRNFGMGNAPLNATDTDVVAGIPAIGGLFGQLSNPDMMAAEAVVNTTIGTFTPAATGISVTTRLDVAWRVTAVGAGGIRTVRADLLLHIEVSYTIGGVMYSGIFTPLQGSRSFNFDLNQRG